MVMLQNGFWKKMFVILWKKWKKLASSSINQSVEKKQCTSENIAGVAESVCEVSTSIYRRFQQLNISEISKFGPIV